MCEYSTATFASSCCRSGGSRPDGNRQKKPRRPHNTAGEEGKDVGLRSKWKEIYMFHNGFTERHRQKAVTDGEHLMENQGR